VVQYRGEILPLVRLASLLGAMTGEPADTVQVVVYSENSRSVGLVVERILDIAEQALTARSDLEEHGLTGSAVVQDHITELLDVRQAILAADPNFYASAPADLAGV
jgi:two-component system chemotaxis sensor kinase CheA